MTREIRLDPDGGLDEVVIASPDFVHLERMDDDSWSLIITTPEGGLYLNLYRQKKEVRCMVSADEANTPIRHFPKIGG